MKRLAYCSAPLPEKKLPCVFFVFFVVERDPAFCP